MCGGGGGRIWAGSNLMDGIWREVRDDFWTFRIRIAIT